MAAVKQQVLNWLYSVLTSEYKDVNRTYNDVAQTLSHYSSLSPRTDVHTYETGASALLLNLSGTLPVVFRGSTYRFPITIWVPHSYPREAPVVYVTPTEVMAVRPGQHVDPQGKVYHPYLVGWAEFWDKSNILDFLAILRDVFAKEPPVISRQQQNTPPRPQPTQAPPPIPPLPPGVGRSPSISSNATQQGQPPSPPPKLTNNAHPYTSPGPIQRDNGPPFPHPTAQPRPKDTQYGTPIPQPPTGRPPASQIDSGSRYNTAPPLPPHQQRQQSFRDSYGGGPPPRDQLQRSPYAQTPQKSQYVPHPAHRNSQPMPPSYVQHNPYPGQPQAQPQHKPPPPPDLIDAPLELEIPTNSSNNLPPPPIPPNPEKDMLLHNLGRALSSQRQHTRVQAHSSLPGLEAQRKAMHVALGNMQAEIQALESLNGLLASNTSILHTALHDADSVIESSQHRTAPNIDEILVAPTVVGNQLYELVSEERGLGDALFVLGRAVEKGRITPTVFAKMTRSLAREWYLKKALAKKIGRGMGLAIY